MKRLLPILPLLVHTALAADAPPGLRGPLPDAVPVRGWTILSDSETDAMATIAAASRYGINHLQLSHHVLMDLRQLREPRRQELAGRLTKQAHEAGIQEVILWDHALYDLSYYPKKFRTGPKGTLDLDNPEFWKWFAQDYREMLDLAPDADGLVLTFVETGARAENQHSAKLKTGPEKLAAVVDAVASVVIGERKLNLYIRTFSYTHAEYANVTAAVRLLQTPGIRLMMKETPHDFFITHPNDRYAGTLPLPTIVEFDTGNEFNGQGIIANTWPEYVLRRASDLLHRPHVVGYVARTDRYGDTRIVGRAGEILLLALSRCADDRQVTAEEISREFIERRYGSEALPLLQSAFSKAQELITSTLYSLGTNTANHSKLNYDPYPSSYARHVSGKWIDPPVVHVAHGIDREFHYWRDVIEHLAPARFKTPEAIRVEAPFVVEQDWVTPTEQMNEEYLGYVVTEKNSGVNLATKALAEIEEARPVLKAEDYAELHALFERTLLTARLHRAVAKAYFGNRVWARGETFQTPALLALIREGLDEIEEVATLVEQYPDPGPVGQWSWREDAAMARGYHKQITASQTHSNP